MANFPTAPDFTRPIPQGGGAVPRGGPSFGLPGGARIPNAPGQIATSSVAARTLEPSGVGAKIRYDEARQDGETAIALDRFGAIADKFALTLDETAAQDALNQLRAKRQELTYDPEKGYQRFKGGAVTKPGPGGQPLLDELPAGLQAAADELGSGLSIRARKMYSDAATRETLGYRRDVAVHLANESEKYEAAVYKDTQLTNLSEAVTVSGDPLKLKEVADRAALAADIRAKQTGLPSQAKQARSNVLRSAIEGQIAAGNGPQALAMYRQLMPDIDGQDRIALLPTMKTVGIGETAKMQANGLIATMPAPGQAEEGTKASLSFWKTEYGEKVAAGITAGFLRESQFFPGARNKGDGRDGSDSINIGQWNAARAQAFAKFAKDKGLDPNDMKTGLLYAKAEIDGEIPRSVSGLSADFKARLQNAKSEQEAADIMTRGYFRPLHQDGESAIRAKSATGILAKYGEKDPLRQGVDAATGVDPGKPKDGPLYRDTRQMLLDAEQAYDIATRRNAEINAGNDDQRRATQSQLDLNLAAHKREIELAKLNLEIGVDKWMTTGGPVDGQGNPTAATSRPPPEIWNQLPYTKQQSIDATIAHNLKGTVTVTDDQVWGEIHRGITSADPAVRAEWAQKPLWEYKRFLSSSDFQELSRMQGQARMGDPNKELTHVQTANQMIDDTLQTLGVDARPSAGKSEAEKANNFRRLAQQQITAFEVEQKRKSTAEEQRKIIDRLAMPTFLGKGWFGDSTKPAYEIKITDLPAGEKEKIVEALKSVGRSVTDDAIVDLYRRGNARPKK